MNNSSVVLIMALPSESQGLFEKAGLEVHYCGIGKVNAAFKTTDLIHQYKPKLILNLGTAGSAKFPTHSLIECGAFVQRDMDLSPLNFPRGETPLDPLPGKLEGTQRTKLLKGICGTGDAFEIGAPKVACDLVDMEAYAMAKVCRKMNMEFMSIKYITDGSDHQAKDDWFKNLKPGAEKLLEFTRDFLR